MPSDYFPVQKNQTELDLSSVKSEAPSRLRNTDVYMSNSKNRELTEYGLAIWSWDDININDEEQLRARIGKYFSFCVENSTKPSVAGLALALNVSKETIFRMVRGDITSERKYSATTVKIIRKIYLLFDSLWTDYMMHGQINPASGIFLGKNLFGYRDVVEAVISPGSSAESASPEELAQKYDALPDSEDPNSTNVQQNVTDV